MDSRTPGDAISEGAKTSASVVSPIEINGVYGAFRNSLDLEEMQDI